MAELIVQSRKIDKVIDHPNADRLDLAKIGGWSCAVPKGSYQAGDLIVYIPPDSLVPESLSDEFGFTKYLSNGRVRAQKLRGYPSYGVIVPNKWNFSEGENVASALGITKYEPPARNVGSRSGSSGHLPDHPKLPKYTSIENLRHYDTVFEDGEEVVVTEKIHGTNSRVAMIDGTLMAGSRRLLWKFPTKKVKKEVSFLKSLLLKILGKPHPTVDVDDVGAAKQSWVWSPVTNDNVLNLLYSKGSNGGSDIILFGEVYGSSVQRGVSYGEKNSLGYRAFDAMVNGQYLDYDDFRSLCDDFDVETAPLLYRGPFSLEKIEELSHGDTTIGNDKHIREGVVVRPVSERHSDQVGRVIMKYVSDEYLQSKNIGDFEDN
jgi:RNA ligase (TIGR02306 family)